VVISMELSTFGGVLNFALELERKALEFYRQAMSTAQDPKLRETLQTLLADSERALRRLERVRREHINEMLLERITGLQEDDYRPSFELFDPEHDILSSARRLEELAHRFYQDAAAQLNLPDVARIFSRLAAGKVDHLRLLSDPGAL